jgi:hypothetical protein
VDYHPSAASARQETSTAATVISIGANSNNSTRVRRDYHERIHLASSSEHRPDYDRCKLDPPEYHPRDRSERMAASPPDDYHIHLSKNIIEPGQPPKVVVTQHLKRNTDTEQPTTDERECVRHKVFHPSSCILMGSNKKSTMNVNRRGNNKKIFSTASKTSKQLTLTSFITCNTTLIEKSQNEKHVGIVFIMNPLNQIV